MPEKTTLLGCCRVITQEYPQLTCRSVDLVLPKANSDQAMEEVAQQLRAEMTCAIDDLEIAYRGRRRWVQAFEPITLPEPNDSVAVLRTQGVYLITGGLRDTGLRLADELTSRVQAKLVLVDSPGSGDSDSTQAQLAALIAKGSEVLFLQADVTDLAQMRRVAVDATARFGAVHGVIHIPTGSNDGIIQLKTLETTRSVLSPYLRGVLALEAAFQGIALDFVALFSSTVAISGGIGQVDECAGHAFLSAYAQSRHSENVLAIDWSLWLWDERYENSTAEFLQVREQFRAHREKFGITQSEMGEALLRVLGSAQPQMVVAPLGMVDVLEQRRALTTKNLLTQLERQPPKPMQQNDRAVDTPADDLEAKIAEVWQGVFGVAHVGRHDNFFTLGGHSLLSIQLISRLRNVLQLRDLPLSLLFERPTVAALAEKIRSDQRADALSLEELALNDDADLAALLTEIETLSADELALLQV